MKFLRLGVILVLAQATQVFAHASYDCRFYETSQRGGSSIDFEYNEEGAVKLTVQDGELHLQYAGSGKTRGVLASIHNANDKKMASHFLTHEPLKSFQLMAEFGKDGAYKLQCTQK